MKISKETKEIIYSKVLTEIKDRYPENEIPKKQEKEMKKLMNESFKTFNDRYSGDNGEFETYIVNSMTGDLLLYFGLDELEEDEEAEDFSIDEDEYEITDEEFLETELTDAELDEYKALEKEIEVGSGHLSSKEKDLLAERNIALIHSIVKRFANTGIEYTELLSAGYVGYAKALQTFAKGKNVKFSTYAFRCIKNEILYFLRREKRHKDNDISLYKPMSTDKNGNVMTVDSTISTEDMGSKSLEEEAITREEIAIMLKVIDEHLSGTEAKIIKARFGIGMTTPKTQKEIADEIGMSQANVSKLEKGIMEKIKKIMNSKYKIKEI